MKKILILIPVLLLTGIIFYACQDAVNVTDSNTSNVLLLSTCPEAGSGLSGVQGLVCTEPCSTIATTCNGEFRIELEDINYDGNLITFEYEICRIGGSSALSHWVLGLDIDCVGDGFNLADIIYGAKLNGEPYTPYLGVDPTTQLFGIKFEIGSTGTCNTYSITFDKSKLEPEYTLGSGCGIVSTKAGNQDITRSNRTSPGYACALVPTCIPDEVNCTNETAFGGNSAVRVGEPGNWFYYYINDGLLQTIYAGQYIEIGTVKYIGDNESGVIEISLNSNASLRPGSETVKIKGYSAPPTQRPTGKQYDSKGNVLTVSVDYFAYYIIHLDVEVCVSN